MEGGWRSLACRRVSGAGVRAAYPADTPYSAGPAAESLDALRLSRPPRVGSASEATPVPEGLPQPGQPAEFEPESEAAVYGRSVGREELQSPIDQVLVASNCHSLRISMAPKPIGGGGNPATPPGQLARSRSQSAVSPTLALSQHSGHVHPRRRFLSRSMTSRASMLLPRRRSTCGSSRARTQGVARAHCAPWWRGNMMALTEGGQRWFAHTC